MRDTAPAVRNRRGNRPRLFRRPRLLIVGCGDVGARIVRLLAVRPGRIRLIATTRRTDGAAALRALGATVIGVDLDEPRSLRRLAGLARWMIDLAPPPAEGTADPRTRRLAAALRRSPVALGAGGPERWVYVSTSGVYGDCAGQRVDETRPVAPASARAVRRVDAERRWRAAIRSSARLRRQGLAPGLARLSILRAPGIYAADRLPVDRLRRGLPALVESDDVHTNHIHADDLARIAWLALTRGRSTRVYHASDASGLMMGEYFDRVADALSLPRPPRLPRATIAAHVPAPMLSFMSESRRLDNRRLTRELRVPLRYPTVGHLLDLLPPAGPV